VQPYGELWRRVLFPIWENRVKKSTLLERLRFLEQSQWRDAEELAALQSIELRRLLRHAHAHVPLYRDRFAATGLHPADIVTAADLQLLPVLTRTDVREAGARRRAVAPPFPAITKRTTGSTGEPLEFSYDQGSEDWRNAIRMRGWGWAGYRLGDRTLHYWTIYARPRLPKLRWRMKRRLRVSGDHAVRREYWVDSMVRSEERFEHAIRVIRRKRPSTIVTITQGGVELGRHVIETGARDWGDIPVLTGAEALLAGDRELLEQAFGPVFETYGNREFMLIATECELHDGLHVQAENLVVEILIRDEDGGYARAAAPGEVGEVVITDLHNLAMPFIRYATGDLARATDGSACPCGRGLPRIASVEGRSADTLVDGDGGQVSGVALMTIFIHLAPAVRQYQIVQRRDRALVVRVVPTPEFDATAKERILGHCADYLPGIPVTIDMAEAIEPSDTGKRRFILVEGD
jgi:phenylacetate-CoA ligase